MRVWHPRRAWIQVPSRGHAQRMDSMENVDFDVDELANFFGGLDGTECLPLSCRRRHHSCIQCFSIYVDSRLRDTRTQVIQRSCGQATNYMPELVPPQPYSTWLYPKQSPTPCPSCTSYRVHFRSSLPQCRYWWWLFQSLSCALHMEVVRRR